MSEVKKCPECGGAMEKGYIITEGIRWSKEKHARLALWEDFIPNVEAYRCTNCKLVMIPHGYEKDKPTPKSFLKNCVRCRKEIPIASEECPHCGAKQKARVR